MSRALSTVRVLAVFLAAIDEEKFGDINDAVKGRHDFVAQTCSKLLWEIVLKLVLFNFEDSCNVIDHKDLVVLDPDLYPLDRDLQDFGIIKLCAQLLWSDTLTISIREVRHGLEVAIEHFVFAGQRPQTLRHLTSILVLLEKHVLRKHVRITVLVVLVAVNGE